MSNVFDRDVKPVAAGVAPIDIVHVVEGVTPFHPGAVKALQEHVHATERPCAALGFLSEEANVTLFLRAARAAGHLLGCLNQKAA